MKAIFSSQHGTERVYSIVGFSILIIILILAWQFGTPYFKNMSLTQYAQELVNFDYHNKRPSPQGVKTIYKKLNSKIKAKKLPIEPIQVKVDYDLEKYSVNIEYEYIVNLFVMKTTLNYVIDKETQRNR